MARVVTYIHSKANEADLTLDMILLLHKMLISNIRDDIAGRFREDGEWVRVGSHVAADPAHVRGLLQDMLAAYRAGGHIPMTERIARFHLTFEQIHPFVDGNGRIGRVLSNYLLLRAGHVPINIKFTDRSSYYDAFDAFNARGDSKIMEDIVSKALSNSCHKRLAYLEGKNITPLAAYAKRKNISHSNLINKAKRQSIPAFWEKGKWHIGA